MQKGLSFVSAGIFSEIYSKVTGNVISLKICSDSDGKKYPCEGNCNLWENTNY